MHGIKPKIIQSCPLQKKFADHIMLHVFVKKRSYGIIAGE